MLVKCAKGYVGLIFHVKHEIYLKPLCAEKCLPFTSMFLDTNDRVEMKIIIL